MRFRDGVSCGLRWLPMILTVVGLIVGWTIVFLIDFAQVPAAWVEGSTLGLAWFEVFSEGLIVENAQWLLLAIALSVALWQWGQQIRVGKDQRCSLRLPLFMLVGGLAVMLIEDSLNFRHVVANGMLAHLFADAALPRSVRTLWEFSFYLLLATLMLVPVVMIAQRLRLSRSTVTLLIAAYGVYGLVAFGSALRRVGDWQERLGAWVIERFGLLAKPNWAAAEGRMEAWRNADPSYTHTLGYLLVDHLIEESVELLAASLLVGAVIAIAQDIRRRQAEGVDHRS